MSSTRWSARSCGAAIDFGYLSYSDEMEAHVSRRAPQCAGRVAAMLV